LELFNGEVEMTAEADESKLLKRMKDLHKEIDAMNDDKFRLSEINLDYIKNELFTSDFMKTHTDFPSFEKMIGSTSFKIENEIEFRDATDTAEWNQCIMKHTEFKNWNEMLRTSVIERATRKLMVKTLQ
jgi:hypothetical protein